MVEDCVKNAMSNFNLAKTLQNTNKSFIRWRSDTVRLVNRDSKLPNNYVNINKKALEAIACINAANQIVANCLLRTKIILSMLRNIMKSFFKKLSIVKMGVTNINLQLRKLEKLRSYWWQSSYTNQMRTTLKNFRENHRSSYAYFNTVNWGQ